MKIFISSPGDVDKERRIAERLIDRLVKEFTGRISIEPYFWEYEPMRHDRNFQDQIPPTSQFDLVICILWSRLGTPLKGPDGREYSSGTEYEVLSARESAETPGKPEVFIYRNLTPAQIRQLPAAERKRLYAQLEALDAFISKYCVDPESGVIKGAFTTYEDLGEFESKLEKHLRKLIEKRLPQTLSALDAPPLATWTEGSPFRGLDVFDFIHAPIFFGRTRAMGDVLALLRKRMSDVEDARSLNPDAANIKPATFVLVSAMSGVGKSSLVRAGVLPLLVQPGDGIALWRRAVMRPGEATGNLFDGLARALCRSEALPELVSGEATIESIGALLRRNPAGIEFGLCAALDHATGLLRQEETQALRQWEQECRRQGRTHDEDRAAQLLEEVKSAKKPARLVLVIDQLEELFTLETITQEERDGFVLALAALARSGKVYVIATLRSDFFSRCAEAPLLVELSRQDGLYHLTPPTKEEIGQIIRQPAQAAGLRFEVLPKTGHDLAERLRDAAIRNPEALPLLEFCLEELYKSQAKRNDGWLRHADYEAMGGLEGALRQRAESVYASLNPEEKEQFGHVMRAVTTVALDKVGVFNRRWADYEELVKSEKTKGFVEAFLSPGARLFVADQTDAGRKVVSVAHEALLSAWGMLKDWLTANQENLRIRATVSAEAKRWRESGRNADYLCPPGLPLEKARQLRREGFLDPEENEYVQASIAQAEALARWRVTVLRRWLVAVGLLAVLAIIGGCFGWWNERVAEIQRQAAVAERQKAIEALSQSDFLQAVSLMNENRETEALPYLARSLRAQNKDNPAAMLAFSLLLRQPVPRQIFLGHAETVRGAAFSPDGAQVVTASDDKTVRIWDAQTGRQLTPTQKIDVWRCKSAFFSPDGTQVATPSGVWNAKTGLPATPPFDESAGIVNTVAYSPDGTRVVTASGSHTAQLWDAHTGRPIGQPMHHEQEEVNSASFSPDGASVVTSCGTWVSPGYAQVWNARTGQPVGQPMRHEKGVNSANFSPDGTCVVTASWDYTARLWNVHTGQPIGQPMRHEGGVNSASFSPDGASVVTASWDKMAHLWDAHTGQPIGQPMRHENYVNSASFSPDGTKVVTASWDNTARVWDAKTGLPITLPLQHAGTVWSAAFSPDSTRIITASGDKTSRIWNAQPSPIAISTSTELGQDAASFNRFSNWNPGQKENAPIKISNPKTGQTAALSMKHNESVCLVYAAFSPDGTKVVTASTDHIGRLWDAHTGRPIGEPLHHGDQLKSATFSPDGTRVVTAATDCTARVWDATTGQPVTPPLKHARTVTFAKFSPDGKWVVTASMDNTARVWDAQTGQPVTPPLSSVRVDSINLSFFGISGFASSNPVGFSADGKQIIASATFQGSRAWDLAPSSPPPEWFGRVLEALAANRLNDHGLLETVSPEELCRLRDTCLAFTSNDPWEIFGRWLFSDPDTRTASPWSKPTVPQNVPPSLVSPH